MTEDDYKSGVALLKKVKPEHDYLPLVERGYSRINAEYLKHALDGINVVQEKTGDDSTDYKLRNLQIDKSRLFKERAKLSNRFHQCKSDAQRKTVSKEIELVQDQIAETFHKIQYIETHGEAPKLAPGETKYEVPPTPLEMHKKIRNLGTQIARQKRELEKLNKLPVNDPERSKIAKYEKKRSELTIHKEIVQKAYDKATMA